MVVICLLEEVCGITVNSSKKCDESSEPTVYYVWIWGLTFVYFCQVEAKHSRWDSQTTAQRPHGGEKLHHRVTQTRNQEVSCLLIQKIWGNFSYSCYGTVSVFSWVRFGLLRCSLCFFQWSFALWLTIKRNLQWEVRHLKIRS